MGLIKRFLLVPALSIFFTTIGFGNQRVVGTSSDSTGNEIIHQGQAYFCNEDLQHPTLVFRSDLGNADVIEFRSKAFEGWTPLERCQEIATRAEEFRQKGIISYLTVEELKPNTMAICISSVDAPHLQLPKEFVRLLITLKPDDDPEEVKNQLVGVSSISKDGKPLIH